MRIDNRNLETVPEKFDWQDHLNTLIEKAITGNPRHFNQLLQNMSLLYNVSAFKLPFKTIILFTDQSFGISHLDTMSLLKAWHDKYAFPATYFNQTHTDILDGNKRLPITLGKFAFQRFHDEKEINHILALHNIQVYYADAQCKKDTWIEVDNHFKYKINLKNKYLREKMGFYATFRQQHLRFFDQMAFYSQFNHFTHHPSLSNQAGEDTLANQQFMVSESAYQPVKAYVDFGQLDSMYQLYANMLYYVFGPEKLKKIAGKNAQKKIRKIQKGIKE
ncbi:hypothetical protein [Aerococcus viridans]|uniref:hypothetical protein n=1 Tax=Aerococcus viridans TaxID=1377 RepID=UPI003B2161A4